MNSIKLRTWILWALILFFLGLALDYFFLHVLFQMNQDSMKEASANVATITEEARSIPSEKIADPVREQQETESTVPANNFRESLQKCAPEIAAQGLGTPEALVEYLKKSVGTVTEETLLENFHLTLPDGSQRRVQVVIADNTNSTTEKELRFFKLDQEGYPERLALKTGDTLQSLLALGKLTRHEVKSQLTLKDGTSLAVELHNRQIFEFQFNNLGRLLSCRHSACHCP